MGVWDKLAVATPLNKTAGVVTSRSNGLSPVGPKPAEQYRDHGLAPRTIAPPKEYDLTGIGKGRLKVVGYLGKLGSKQIGSWLVRCACGAFENRTAKAIKNPANTDDACRSCRHVQYLRRRFSCASGVRT